MPPSDFPEPVQRAQRILENLARSWGRQTTGLNADARGMRNNNPGNLEANGWTAGLPGYVGSDGRFARFDNLQDGQAALDRNLQGYGQKGIDTALAIASRWAPGSERGNNPNSYGAAIARALGVGPNDPVDLSDPDTRVKIGQAIAFVENGPGKAALSPAAGAIDRATAGQGGGAPQQNSRALTFQVPLPRGYTPEQAVMEADREIDRLAAIPGSAQKIRNLESYRDSVIKSYGPMEVRSGQTIVDPQTGEIRFRAPSMFDQRNQENDSQAKDIADAIASGDQPPTTTGLYRVGPAVRQALAQKGVSLAKLQLQYKAAERQVASLNGPQMTRFAGLANSVVNTIDEVKDLSEQMKLSGIPLLNKAELASYIQTQGNSENGQLATRYLTAVGVLKEEFASLANGGYAPTEPAWHLADQQINGNYGMKQLEASLDEAQRLIKYRLNAMPGMNTVGPGAANPYLPGGGQAPQPGPSPAARSTISPGSTAGLPAGTYRYDPSTGALEPVK